MTLLNQLSRDDVMFIAGETETIYQHVAGLTILDTSDAPGFNFERFREHCIERISLIPHFRWRLHAIPMGLDRPYWVADENFSFEHHIKRIALPAPGDQAMLCEVASHLYSRHLNRRRPLWEVWFIEGLEDGKCAYLQKFHHCMMDGEGAFKMIEIVCDFEPEPSTPKVVDKTISEAKAGEIPNTNEASTKAWRHLARLPSDAAKGAYDILRPRLMEQLTWPRKPRENQPEVPTACFNGVIDSDRAMTVASVSLTDLKTIKTHFNTSLNDVVLAIVGSAVRDYLLDRDKLPAESLRTNIPVSLRSEGDDQLSNKVTTTTVTLATNLSDPRKRLKAINAESVQAKAHAHSGATGIVELFQMMPPVLVATMMGTLPEDQAPQILGANLIVSNIHGSPLPIYIAGARVEKMYPMSILTAGMGINITCISYIDEMDFGIIVEPDLVPDHDEIAQHLGTATDTYLKLCKPKARKAKRPKKKASAKTKSGTRSKASTKTKTKASAPRKKPKAKAKK
jgi:diacylglycerol O-acyltransferase / wax synthase